MTNHHSRKHRKHYKPKGGVKKGGAAFLDGAAFDSHVYGTGSQQLNYIASQGTGPSNPTSATLPASRPSCILGGGKSRKRSHKKSHKKKTQRRRNKKSRRH